MDTSTSEHVPTLKDITESPKLNHLTTSIKVSCQIITTEIVCPFWALTPYLTSKYIPNYSIQVKVNSTTSNMGGLV